jgi:hypothetical protein
MDFHNHNSIQIYETKEIFHTGYIPGGCFFYLCYINVFPNFSTMNSYYGKSHSGLRIRHLPAQSSGRHVFISYQQKDNKCNMWMNEDF